MDDTAVRLWSRLPDDIVAGLGNEFPLCVLRLLVRLDRRTRALTIEQTESRLAKLKELWCAQNCGAICCQLMLLDWMLGAGSWQYRRISIVHIEPRGLKALGNALDALAFPQAKELRILYCEVTDIGLRSLLPPLIKGALPLLEEFHIKGNYASDAFLVAFSDAVTGGAMGSLRRLNLSCNFIGNAGVKAFASACSCGAFPRLELLNLVRNDQLGDPGASDFATTLEDSRSLPLLRELLVSNPLPAHPRLNAACRARGIDLHDGKIRPAGGNQGGAPSGRLIRWSYFSALLSLLPRF